jgi:hypothetical protein
MKTKIIVTDSDHCTKCGAKWTPEPVASANGIAIHYTCNGCGHGCRDTYGQTEVAA